MLSGTCGFTLVHAEVHAFGVVDVPQFAVCRTNEFEEFLRGVIVDPLQGVRVFEGDDHEVAGCIRIAVENNVIETGAVDN